MASKRSRLHPLPLKEYYSIPFELFGLNIAHITSAMDKTYSPKSMDLLFKRLHSMDVHKIGVLMNKTLGELEEGGLKSKSQELLLNLLQRVKDDPNILPVYQLVLQNNNLWN